MLLQVGVLNNPRPLLLLDFNLSLGDIIELLPEGSLLCFALLFIVQSMRRFQKRRWIRTSFIAWNPAMPAGSSSFASACSCCNAVLRRSPAAWMSVACLYNNNKTPSDSRGRLNGDGKLTRKRSLLCAVAVKFLMCSSRLCLISLCFASAVANFATQSLSKRLGVLVLRRKVYTPPIRRRVPSGEELVCMTWDST